MDLLAAWGAGGLLGAFLVAVLLRAAWVLHRMPRADRLRLREKHERRRRATALMRAMRRTRRLR